MATRTYTYKRIWWKKIITHLLVYRIKALYAKVVYNYYRIMQSKIISRLEVGDFLYTIDNTDSKVKKLKILKKKDNYFELGFDYDTITNTVYCENMNSTSINRQYFPHPMMAIWATIMDIRNQQYRLEKRRIEILKENGLTNVKVTVTETIPDSK